MCHRSPVMSQDTDDVKRNWTAVIERAFISKGIPAKLSSYFETGVDTCFYYVDSSGRSALGVRELGFTHEHRALASLERPLANLSGSCMQIENFLSQHVSISVFFRYFASKVSCFYF